MCRACVLPGLRYEDFVEVITEIRAQFEKEQGPMRDRKASKLYER